MDYLIRFLHSDELSKIESIARAFFVEAKYQGQFAFDKFSQFWESLIAQGNAEIFVAERFGEVVGLIGVFFTPDMYNGSLSTWVNFWYVLPDVRGTGLGARLFATMEQESRVRGASSILAGHLLAINSDGFRGFFESKGFSLRELSYRKELKQ